MATRNGSFGAVANDATVARGATADLVVGGTFVGTIQLQVCIPGVAGAELWVPIGAGLTAPGTITYQAGCGRAFRAACTAWTSGTIFYSLGAFTLDDMID
ncbi:hypothetical protein UFOVP143_56 [uncultured Caudovirales phage]|uniref:Uncharacterized protein n=1 Tax=uncultured Caudovirales phage TaxID=2100421 RepID=A0A6J7VP26_9CAUD|nr:hypothetical protein UFOVP143_56 [uncultured Caudovirales phage]